MNGIIKACFWLILICGISGFLFGLTQVSGMTKTAVSIGGNNLSGVLGLKVLGVANLISGALLILSAIFLTKEKTRKIGGIIALILSFIVDSFDSTGTGNTLPVLLVASIFALTNKNS